MRRRLLQSESDGIPNNVVDLGLPSGTLWTTGNLCKNGSNYYIGSETDWGTYVSWGNIDGHNEGEGYDWKEYSSTTGASLNADISATDAAHDICLARLGKGYSLPTKEQFLELYANTDNEYTTINGVAGYIAMKKSDHSVYVFFPASGLYYGNELVNRGAYGYYWNSSFSSNSDAYLAYFNSSGAYMNALPRPLGVTVRPVYSQPITSKTLSYTINQTNPIASPTSIIVKNTPSNQASPSTDVIAWINENTDIVVADTTLSNGQLRCAKTSRADKTKYPDGTSITDFTSKDVFVKLPEFWWKVEEDSTDVYKIGFSKEAKSGWKHWEGNTFIGVYEAYGEDVYVYSRSGVTPVVGAYQFEFALAARNKGAGYSLITYEAHCMMALLGYGWLGTTNSLSVVGYGSTNYPRITGKCNSLGMTDTTISNGGSGSISSTSISINFWGIENWWGDIIEFIDNLETANTLGLVNVKDLSGATVRTVQLPVTIENGWEFNQSNAGMEGYIGKMMLGEYGDMIPKESHSTGDNGRDGFCDYCGLYFYTEENYVFVRSMSGNAEVIDSGGLGFLGTSGTCDNTSGSDLGSRLQYKGDYIMVDKL